MNSQHAVAVLIISPDGIPLVRDPKKPIPRYWKLPGGRSKEGETPEECAVREIKQEIGLAIDQDNLEALEQEDRGSHTLTFFKIAVPSLKKIKNVGDEQEEIKIFSQKEIIALPDLFPNHRGVVQKHLL
ncbi:MAG: NUDIX hydrolase [bacterium]|nr:NUDIX hydrolase [bacterium]